MTSANLPQSLRITHCSDIHLEGDHYSDEHYKDGFMRVLEVAQRNSSHLLIVAGDLFDTNRTSDETIQWTMNALAQQPLPVAMIPGNHDCMEPGGNFYRYDFDALPNVEMITSLEGEVRRFDALGLAVWGKAMVEHCAEYRPIANIPRRPDSAQWFLGMGHGIYVSDERESDRSSPVHQHEIAASPCDYIALGHHHAALEVHTDRTAAAYSGSPTDQIGKGATYATIDLSLTQSPQVEIRLLADD